MSETNTTLEYYSTDSTPGMYDDDDSSTFSTNTYEDATIITLEDKYPSSDMEDDDFMFHVMYGILGVIGFIVMAILLCFVYRNKQRANRNIRRVRPRSRPGTLSMELLERDLMPQAASQPLYGVENSDHTDSSIVSISFHRIESQNRSTRPLNPVVENGSAPSSQQKAEVAVEEEGRPSTENDTGQYEMLVSPNTQISSNRTPAIPPKKTPSAKKKTPPPVAKKPSSSSIRSAEKQKVNTKDDSTENQEYQKETAEYVNDPKTVNKPNAVKTPSNAASEYENPAVVVLDMAQCVSNIPPQSICVQQPLNDVFIDDENFPEENEQVYEIGEFSDSVSDSVFDLNQTMPPPSPCSNKVTCYVNTTIDDSNSATLKVPDKNGGHKSGYINIPGLKDSQQNGESPSVSLGYVNFPCERERKSMPVKGTQDIQSEEGSEYVNLKAGIMRRGHSTSILPVVREKLVETRDASNKDVKEDEYVHMAKDHDPNNEYVSMKPDYVVMKAQDEDEYIDMTTPPTPHKLQGSGYMNTMWNDRQTAGYAVPRVKTYKLTRNVPRYVNTGRSKSSEDVYDYADLKSIKVTFDNNR